MTFDRKYLLWGLGYAIVGMGVGIFMAATHNHGQFVSHAHIMLAGFVVSIIYAVIHKLWLALGNSGLASVQFWAHQLGALTLGVGLLLVYGTAVPADQIEPFLIASSLAVLAAAVMMLVLVLKSRPART